MTIKACMIGTFWSVSTVHTINVNESVYDWDILIRINSAHNQCQWKLVWLGHFDPYQKCTQSMSMKACMIGTFWSVSKVHAINVNESLYDWDILIRINSVRNQCQWKLVWLGHFELYQQCTQTLINYQWQTIKACMISTFWAVSTVYADTYQLPMTDNKSVYDFDILSCNNSVRRHLSTTNDRQ